MDQLYEQRLKHDFWFYCQEKLYVPSETDFNGDPIPMIITDKHIEAIHTTIDNKFVEIIGYRWWGKSQLFSYAYALWRADMWNESSAILSSNETLAMQKLDWIRTEVEFGNPKLNNLSAASLSSMTWNRWEIWLIDKRFPIAIIGRNGEPTQTFRIKAKIYALGIFGSFRGIHVHNIIADDIIVEENSNTHEMREQVKRKFLGAAWGMKLRGDKTRVILVGTPQHPDDLLMTIRREDNNYGKFFLPVLNEQGLPSCPEMHTLEWIVEQREFVGEKIFKQEYMLEAPDINAINFFGDDILETAKNRKTVMLFNYQKLENEIVLIGTDFSIIEDKRHAEEYDNDYFALIAVAHNTITGKRRCLNIYRERGIKKTSQLNMVKLWAMIYEADFIGVEKHAFLSWALSDLKNSSMLAKLYDTGDTKGKYNMDTGIPSLQYTFEQEKYEFPYGDDYSKELVNALFTELKALNKANHDDLADALLRIELIVRAHEGGLVSYDKDFNIYKTMSKSVQKQNREKKATNARLLTLTQW